MSGTLYICATPIGNLGDMTPRAIETLKTVDLIACEDTRNSMKLMNYFDIKTPLTSYHEFNKYDKAEELIKKLLEGSSIAIITDAGTPCISDPGEVLVKRCAEEGITVTSLPGASAVITALTLSALPTGGFVFEGFLPNKKLKKDRNAALERIKDETRTIVLYEAPHHLKETLEELCGLLGAGRKISLCREMTKLHEEVIRCTLEEAVKLEPRGEYVLVLEGKNPEELENKKREAWEELSLQEHVRFYEEKGLETKEAMRAAAKDRGISRRDVYNALNNDSLHLN